ncbi:DUF2851 family protein [Prosthecobacter fusiformis]|uniref:DUF2851 family protein n=1 Tax=Prosthecobacter fusiformis TaxID=48464 RepID=UPI001AAF3778|nr:DUF2851 family protein [Prosthecobacter fusiformis]
MNLPLAARYTRFRESVYMGLEEITLPGYSQPMSELDLQSLWFGGSFGSQFTSVDGKAVRIVDFGIWNSSAGPDFTGCTVEVGGQKLRGDIELDPDARDWERHAHGANQDYTKVVLHLFMDAPLERFFTRNCEHREIVQVQLNPASLPDQAKPNLGLAAARLGRCHAPLREMETERVQSLLESAAQHRLEKKSLRLHRCVAAHGREQAVYQALAQALGYRNNQQPFNILAQRLPVKRLQKLPPAERESLLFGVSGFLESVRYEDTLPETRAYLRELWESWWKQRDASQRWLLPQQALRWKLAAIRPGNHPQRRLGALAAMLKQWPQVSAPLLDAGRWSQEGWRETLLSLKHDFWSTHYTLLAEGAAKPLALIGETRVQEMLANVAYPLLMPERTRLWAEYLELPALLDNQKVRRAVQRLFGDSPQGTEFQKKLHHHQGLLQIYEDFCLQDDSACADCPFPERLKDWS